MSYLTADEPIMKFLTGIMVPVEIRDPTGKVLGFFTPVLPPEVVARYERNIALFDLEEAERIAARERQGHTTEEVLRRLASLENKMGGVTPPLLVKS